MAKRFEKVEISTNAEGDPVSIKRNGGKRMTVAIHERWRLEDGWGGDEEKRCYYRIQTDRGSVYDIYHELVADCWYLDRIYD
mgnify:CR=1 FL=1